MPISTPPSSRCPPRQPWCTVRYCTWRGPRPGSLSVSRRWTPLCWPAGGSYSCPWPRDILRTVCKYSGLTLTCLTFVLVAPLELHHHGLPDQTVEEGRWVDRHSIRHREWVSFLEVAYKLRYRHSFEGDQGNEAWTWPWPVSPCSLSPVSDLILRLPGGDRPTPSPICLAWSVDKHVISLGEFPLDFFFSFTWDKYLYCRVWTWLDYDKLRVHLRTVTYIQLSVTRGSPVWYGKKDMQNDLWI